VGTGFLLAGAGAVGLTLIMVVVIVTFGHEKG
jgi:hypothetical protein